MKTNNEMIRTEDLKRSFNIEDNRVDVLKSVNLTIYEGEFVTIMGKSGLRQNYFTEDYKSA